MYTPEYHRFFKKDIERDKKSGQFVAEDFTLLKEIMSAILNDEILPEKYKNHPLKGEWEGTYGYIGGLGHQRQKYLDTLVRDVFRI